MKITLIQPRKPSYGVEADEHWQLTRPFSLFYLAASIQKHTPFDVDIIDLEQKKYRDISYEELFKNNKSDIFGLTGTTYTRFEVFKIARALKACSPGSPVIAGGVHFMYCAKDTLENIPEIDIVVRGEGEETIVELSQALDRGKDIDTIKGISYRKNNRVIENPDRKFLENLDNIPAYSDYTWEEYPEYIFAYPGNTRAISILSSRGCPYNCIFCSKAGMKYRLRTAKNVVDEIEFLKEKHKVTGINFLDLTFTANPNHVLSLCEEMISRNIDMQWWCESRVNIPLDLLDLMKKAGCVSIAVGVESGSPRIITGISKGIAIEQVLRFCKKCHEIGIVVSPYFMFSHPDETAEDVRKTLDLIGKLEKFTNSCSFQPTMIFPGTGLERIARRKGILPQDFSWSHPYEGNINRKLGQFPNVPLFIDKLTPGEMIDFPELKRKRREYKNKINYISQMNAGDYFKKAFYAIKNGSSSIKYLFSPRFYYDLVTAKIKKYRKKA
jgi:anaerobic magnesium-protoporphyrin IX monomethyl ester cyclase